MRRSEDMRLLSSPCPPESLGGRPNPDSPEQATARAAALEAVNQAGVPCVVAGAYALREYTGLMRDTKDLDLFIRRADVPACLEALRQASFRTEVTDPVWLAKGFHPSGEFVDVIYSSGNGVADVDDAWLERARPAMVLGVPAWVAPPEEIIWSKAFVCERERYDGADINRMLRHCHATLDWEHLYRRFEPHPEVLLSYLLLFRFSYPGLREAIPEWLLERLYARCREPAAPGQEGLCRGTLLSRYQYLPDLEEGLVDARRVEVASYRTYHDGRI
jgi:hypothetical protein